MGTGIFVRSLCRGRWTWSGAAALASLTAALVVAAGLLSGSGLSRLQLEEREFGPFDRRLQVSLLGNFDLADPSLLGRLTQRIAEEDEGHKLAVTAISPDLRVSVAGRAAAFLELVPSQWDDRYVLVSGRWPVTAGEAVVAESLSVDGTVVGSTVTAVDGTLRLDVVGTYVDTWSRRSRMVLAAPGTWSQIPRDPVGRLGPVSAVVFVYWSSSIADDDVLDAVLDVVPDREGQLSGSELPTPVEDRSSVVIGSVDWSRRLPMVFALPSVVVTMLAAAAVAVFNVSRFRRIRRIFIDNGTRERTATGLVVMTVLWICLSGLAMGCAAGMTASVGARSVLARFSTRPIGPWPDWTPLVARLLIGMVAGAILGCIVVVAGGSSGPRIRQQRSGVRHARLAGSLILGVTAVATATRADSAPSTFVVALELAAGLCCVLPEVIGCGAALCGEWTLATKLIRRRTISRCQPLALQSTIIVLTLVSAWVLAIVISTSAVSGQSSQVARAAPGVAIVERPDGSPLDPELASLSTDVAELPRSVPLLNVLDPIAGSALPRTERGGVLCAVEHEAELSQLLPSIDPTATDVLTRGGAAVLRDFDNDVLEVEFADEVHVLPAVHVSATREFAEKCPAVVLARTARRSGLPVSLVAMVFPNVDRESSRRVVEAVASRGFGSAFVALYRPPEPIVPALGFWSGLIGSSMVAIVVNSLLARFAAREVRRYVRPMAAVGVPDSWLRRIVAVETSIPVLIGVPAAAIATAASIILLGSTSDGPAISVPYGQMASIVVLIVLGQLLAVGRSWWTSARTLLREE